MPTPASTPLIAITPDLTVRDERLRITVTRAYAERIAAAGGHPVVLPALPMGDADIPTIVERFDAFVLTGGDDPRTEPFGAPTDQRVTPVHPERQLFETALLTTLRDTRPDAPVLGVCLGMQMLALTEGGALDQYMPDTHPTHAGHWDADHDIAPEPTSPLPAGTVHSRHKQCVSDPGAARVTARAPDGVIEAIDLPARRSCVGVQWHPERTDDPALGQALFDALVNACD